MVESETITQQTRRSLRPHNADQVSSISSLTATIDIPGHAPTQHQHHSAGVSAGRQPVSLIGKPHLRTPNTDTTEGSRYYVLALVHVPGYLVVSLYITFRRRINLCLTSGAEL